VVVGLVGEREVVQLGGLLGGLQGSGLVQVVKGLVVAV
jgi:hypothetical protein